MSNDRDFKLLTPGERLGYIVAMYFRTQQEFADVTGISFQLINQYINGRIASVPRKNAMQIEARTGVSSAFIMTGETPVLVPSAKLVPYRPLGNVVPPSLSGESSGIDKVKEKKLSRGECNQMTITKSGYVMNISDTGIVNIADLAFDSLKNPVAVHVVDVEFCRKYDVKVGVTYIIDKEHYTDGNIVLAKHKLEFFIAQLYEGKLMDIARSGVDIALDDTVKIIGAVYKKLEMM